MNFATTRDRMSATCTGSSMGLESDGELGFGMHTSEGRAAVQARMYWCGRTGFCELFGKVKSVVCSSSSSSLTSRSHLFTIYTSSKQTSHTRGYAMRPIDSAVMNKVIRFYYLTRNPFDISWDGCGWVCCLGCVSVSTTLRMCRRRHSIVPPLRK